MHISASNLSSRLCWRLRCVIRPRKFRLQTSPTAQRRWALRMRRSVGAGGGVVLALWPRPSTRCWIRKDRRQLRPERHLYGDFTEKRTSGMSRPTPIAAVPPPGQLTSRGQSIGVADRHATTAGAARGTVHKQDGRRGGDLYGGGCPCSSTPCAGTRGRDKARGAQKVEHMF